MGAEFGKKLNVGVIGAGRIGKLHTENLLRNDAVRVKGISDLRIGEMTDWLAGKGISNISDGYEDIVRDPEIDAVFVCSSTDTHTAVIGAAAAGGKHIFCEKPISFHVNETRRALAHVQKAGVKLQAGFNRRFDFNFARVRELIREGKVGTPEIVKITSRDPSPPPYDYIRVSGGLLFDMAIHDFDMARFLSRDEVVEVYVQGAVLVDAAIGDLGDIDTAVTTLKFANGAIGVIDNSRRASYGYDQRVEVHGSAGAVTVQNAFDNSAEWSTSEGVFRDKPQHFFLERYREAYLKETQSFIESIFQNKPVAVDGNDALQAELIACAAKRSLQERRPVRLAEFESFLSV